MRLFFSTLTARRIIGSWVEDYTTARSHSSFWTTRRRHSPPNISPQLATTPRHPTSACWPLAHIAPESEPTPWSPPPAAAWGSVAGNTWVVSRIFRTFGLAERRPALAHAV